ncbi:hypothetical protein LSCM1_05896 [Leishmania martiniquensis]|uniref:Succinate dehydrogenase assembly factor 3 n=1 Tax=Leishmania martiniquensis TaxID=1580590 RepID=A0A836KSJ3_9TRYP|nr:hypothetical protein LSCM1_05896 [Leishmania martiniquensis]
MWAMRLSYVNLASSSKLVRSCCGALVAPARRYASSASGRCGRGDGAGAKNIDVDAVVRPMGYGPFSVTAKARLAREKTQKATATSDSAAPAASATVMSSVGLGTNLSLRLSLAGLTHPSQLQKQPYKSPEWRLSFVRLYRTILRLHNKEVAVSLRTSREQGPEAALSAVTGVCATSQVTATNVAVGATEADHSLAEDEGDYLLRYLLTPEQQEFGNRFVQGEFTRHTDADAVAATIFYTSWYEYVLQLASGVTAREMTQKEKRLLTDEQKETLNSLRGALRASRQPQYMP